MSTDLIEIPTDSTLNIEGKENVALCPMCTTVLESASKGYSYVRTNPDTRWFFCSECSCHLGFHRMKRRWKVDPHELNSNDKVRSYFGLDPVK